ncbi:MAG: RNA polymerase sigma factor, partial [Actinobacteria bacterium]|nr:RNA polymerase sigma factor [Actinomycetota bacterium]
QQTFASAFRALPNNQQLAQVKPWLYAIARNRCITMLRARRETPVEEVERVSTAGLSEEVERRTELQELLADLDHLPERQKTALVLSEVGDLDHSEIAQVLECETKQVKALVFQARSALIEDRRAREVPCTEIREQLATASAGALRRSFLRRHVRVCSGCADFRDEVRRQRGMLAVALPVVPSLGLKESVLAAVGFSGGGAAGGGGLLAALGAHGAAKVAAVAIATGGALGGAAVALPEPASKAEGTPKRVTPDARGGASGPSVSSRRGATAERASGSFDSDAARQTARKKGRRSEMSTAAVPVADERKDRPSREHARSDEGPARPIPKAKHQPHGQSRTAGSNKDRGRGLRGAAVRAARSRSNGS